MSINHVSITGNLTRSPELRSTAGGTDVLSFGIAVNDRRKNASGQWEDVPNFFECVTFGNRATALSDILTKGMKVAIAGKLQLGEGRAEALEGGYHRKRCRADAEPQAAAGATARAGGGLLHGFRIAVLS